MHEHYQILAASAKEFFLRAIRSAQFHKNRLNFSQSLATCGCIMAPYGPETLALNYPLARDQKRP
jgi:hypothetical protein